MKNIRLDFISNIDANRVKDMTNIRLAYIALDAILQTFEKLANFKDSGAGRTTTLARNNLEVSLQYAIKSLSLIGEEK